MSHDPPVGTESPSTELPTFGVHVLSEFTFCPRAGLIAMGQERTDWGDDYWLRPNLDYKPSYALYELRRQLVAALLIASALGVSFCGLLAGDVWLLARGQFLPLAGGVLLMTLLSFPLGKSLGRVANLVAELRRIQALTPREPDPDSPTPQRVVWWEMLRAGYDPVRLPEPIRSRSQGLNGHPWRILRKGSIQIPVFRIEGENPERFYPKHAIRAAAYCRLLEAAIGVRSPYAIAILADTYNGWTIPNSAQAQALLDQLLGVVRTTLSETSEFGPPTSTAICTGCPHGAPRVYRRGVSETRLFDELVRPRGAASREDVVYHSTCGDRFGWTPPHAASIKLGLRVDEVDAPTRA